MFQHLFMQRALLVGAVLALVLPCIGLMVVLRKQSMIGDALSHNALAGVATGLMLGFNPLVGAMMMSIVSAFGIEYFRKKMGRYSEMAIAIVLSSGIGLASILSDFVPAGSNFNSFLFGSIIAVSKSEVILTLVICSLVILLFILLYKALFMLAYSPQQARLTGINVSLVEFTFIIMTATTVSLASRTVGALVVTSFMIIPVACAMQVCSSFRSTLIFAICLSEIFVFSGLVASYQLGLKPGGTFVLLSVACLVLITLTRKIFVKAG